MVKHESLWSVVAEVTGALGGESLRLVDHWDSDYFAIGIASSSRDYPLIYVSTHGQEPGACGYQVESDADGTVVEKRDLVTVQLLVTAAKRHLSG